jgi:tetratricopeptide (TPR) repeat protein
MMNRRIRTAITVSLLLTFSMTTAAQKGGANELQFNRKQYEFARTSLERAIALDPNFAKAHYHLSLTLARLGEKEAAAREAELAVKLEREQKEQRRVILRLLENELDVSSSPKP